MKVYKSLLLAYVDVYHSIDFELLAQEFHVKKRQIMEWLIELERGGYIVRDEKGFSVTQAGKKYQSVSWRSFVDGSSKEKEETFNWDFLYIPKDFNPDTEE